MLDKQKLIEQLPLQGQHTSVDQFRISDLTDEYIGWLNDQDVVRYSNQRFKKHDRESCLAYFASLKSSDCIFILIRSKDGKQAIGTMSVHLAPQHGTADIGILIGEKTCWGKGFGLDAWKLVLQWLAQDPFIRKTTAGTAERNCGMVKIMERSGMQFEAARIDQELIGGEPTSILYYAKFNRS